MVARGIRSQRREQTIVTCHHFSLKFVQCVSALRCVHIACVGYQTDSLHLCQCVIPPCLLLLISLGKRSMNKNKNTTRLFRETLLASPHALVVTQVGWKEGDWEYLIGIPNGRLQARIRQVKEEDRLKGWAAALITFPGRVTVCWLLCW